MKYKMFSFFKGGGRKESFKLKMRSENKVRAKCKDCNKNISILNHTIDIFNVSLKVHNILQSYTSGMRALFFPPPPPQRSLQSKVWTQQEIKQ